MSKKIFRDTTWVNISAFYENYLLEKYDMSPPYQRQSIWTDEEQSFFIDSILKNFPIPPIFLNESIDVETGKTKFSVVDGKQRLTSIIRFIDNEIPVASDAEDSFEDMGLTGKYFRDLDAPKLQDYKLRFWKYKIPVEMIDLQSSAKEGTPSSIVNHIFDRLNRNVKSLTHQELRKAVYHKSELHKLALKCCTLNFWKKRFEESRIDERRMKHIEFISEILFSLIENKMINGTPKNIDALYKKYSENNDLNWKFIGNSFRKITKYMEDLNLPYKKLKINSSSNYYSLFFLSKKCIDSNTPSQETRKKLLSFFKSKKDSKVSNITEVQSYIESLSYRTKSDEQRKRRMAALVSYCID